jgi:predicted secreted protein
MNTLKQIAACALLACATSLFAQTPAVPVNVAQLSATGTVEVQQDLLVITMNTTASGQDATVVQSQLKQALDAALAVARPAVQSGQLDVRTGNFSLYPRYDQNAKVNGWQGTTELVLDGRDFSRITATAGKIKSLTLANISFGLSREQRAKVEDEAQAIAIERFKAKALAVSEGFGFSAYTLREVRISADNQGGQPRPASNARMAESPVPVEAGKTTVLINVSGSVQMR